MIAVTLHKSKVSFYSLAYPVLAKGDVFQVVNKKGQNKVVWIVLVCLLVFSGPFILVLRSKRKRILNKAEVLPELATPSLTVMELPNRKGVSAIYFLGGFQLFDKDGIDITHAFTPILKQLFTIVFLYTIKNGRGISSLKLKDALWPDKSENSAKNNRNVSISKLRGLIEHIGNIKLEQEDNYWKIRMENVYSDYMDIASMIERFKMTGTFTTESEIVQFVQFASSGELLPNVQLDWMDEFKADFSNEVIDTLSGCLSHPFTKNNEALRYHIAECILKYDTIHEEAIALKCSILCNLGKNGLARNTYDLFQKEYKNLLGTPYPLSFNEFIEKKSKL